MGGAILISALGFVGLILGVLFLKLGQNEDQKHYPLQILLLFFILGIIVLMGKTTLDYKDNCAWLVSNDTVAGNTTIYQYAYTCSANTANTSNTFYEWTIWIMRIIALYMCAYLIYSVLKYMGWVGGGKGEGT